MGGGWFFVASRRPVFAEVLSEMVLPSGHGFPNKLTALPTLSELQIANHFFGVKAVVQQA